MKYFNLVIEIIWFVSVKHIWWILVWVELTASNMTSVDNPFLVHSATSLIVGEYDYLKHVQN